MLCSKTVALTKNSVNPFSAQDMKVRVYARVRISTVAQSFFICRTHANYSTTPVGFSEREFIEADQWCPSASPGLFRDVISVEKSVSN